MPHIVDAVRCPECGSSSVQHWEEAIAVREIAGIDDTGKLWVIAQPETGDGDNERLHCIDCQHEWPLPENTDFM